MNGSSGIPINTINTGMTNQSAPSTYMDQVRSGWKDAWIASTFYTTLNSMAELENIINNKEKRDYYQLLAQNYSDLVDQPFWNETIGRYVALIRGLGDHSKADRILDWLSKPSDPILIVLHYDSTDVYHNVLSARTTTENVAQSDWDGLLDPDEGRRPYGGLVEIGGTMIWLTYYDVMSRLRFNYTDQAFEILNRMLERIDNDSYCLTFNYERGRIKDDFGKDFVQIGSNFPFPESGIAVLSFLHGFVGVSAKSDGLHICTQLPSPLDFVQANVNYFVIDLTIQMNKINR